MRAGALTSGLRTMGSLNLEVIDEYACGLSRDEARCLKRPMKSPVWVREVVMSINGIDCVVARSLTPLVASHGVWQGMRKLRSRPLADILYNQRSIVRSAFEVARLNRVIPLNKTAKHILALNKTANLGLKKTGTLIPGKSASHTTNQILLARRSVFWRNGYPLMVAECFLPDFWLQIAH
jgi:chorismate--pyruvate lyase